MHAADTPHAGDPRGPAARRRGDRRLLRARRDARAGRRRPAARSATGSPSITSSRPPRRRATSRGSTGSATACASRATTSTRCTRASRDAGFGAEVKRRILLGTFALSAGYADAYYKRAIAVQAPAARGVRRGVRAVRRARLADEPVPGVPDRREVRRPASRCTSATCSRCRPTSRACRRSRVPVGRTDDGLPIGLQVWGRRGRDDRVLRVAAAIQTAADCRYVAPALAAEAP